VIDAGGVGTNARHLRRPLNDLAPTFVRPVKTADFDRDLAIVAADVHGLRHLAIKTIGNLADGGDFASHGILDELVRDSTETQAVSVSYF
jgi:hypothetical protein